MSDLLVEIHNTNPLKVSEHFLKSETACRCGCKLTPNFQAPDFGRMIQVLEYVRAYCGGHPVIINSWVRCQNYNFRVEGGANSRHLSSKGYAVDIAITNDVRYAKVLEAIHYINILRPNYKIYGIGLGKDFIHIDLDVRFDNNKPQTKIWTY